MEETVEKKGMSAKTASLISKLIGVVVLLGGGILKGFGKLPGLEVSELCLISFSIMGIFGTVDLNIMIDKFVKKEK